MKWQNILKLDWFDIDPMLSDLKLEIEEYFEGYEELINGTGNVLQQIDLIVEYINLDEQSLNVIRGSLSAVLDKLSTAMERMMDAQGLEVDFNMRDTTFYNIISQIVDNIYEALEAREANR